MSNRLSFKIDYITLCQTPALKGVTRKDREAISNYSCTSLQAIALLTLNRLPRNIVLSHQMNGHVVGCILGHELFQNITLDSNMYMRCNNCSRNGRKIQMDSYLLLVEHNVQYTLYC